MKVAQKWAKWYIQTSDHTLEFIRGVAQPGRAPASGAGGRRFKSSRPDHKKQGFTLRGVSPLLLGFPAQMASLGNSSCNFQPVSMGRRNKTEQGWKAIELDMRTGGMRKRIPPV